MRAIVILVLGVLLLLVGGSMPARGAAPGGMGHLRLDYATYLPARHAGANAVAVAADGSAVIGGDRDGRDGFITRINPTGTAITLDLTLHGDIVNGVAVGPGGIYATGVTTDPGQRVAGDRDTCRQGDAFVARFDAAGRPLYLLCLGGAGDSAGNAVAVDSGGNAVITGQTYAPDFPTFHALQPHYGIPHMRRSQTSDAFVAKVNPSGEIVYSTYLGGRHNDEGHGVALDRQGNAYVTGWTASADFPLRPKRRGYCRGASPFLSIINSGGTRLLSSVCFAGRDLDSYAGPIVRDPAGFLYIGGHGSDDTGSGFVLKIDRTGQRVLRRTTVLGGVQSMALDGADDLLLTGATSSTALPLAHPLAGRRQHGFCGLEDVTHACSDAFLLALNARGHEIFGTYLGGWRDDVAHGVAVDRLGRVLLAGFTASRHFPIYRALQPFNPGVGDTYHGGPDSGWAVRLSATPLYAGRSSRCGACSPDG